MSRLRRRIATESARLLQAAPELSLAEAKALATQRLAPLGVRSSDVPSSEEVTRLLRGNATPAPGDDRFAVYRKLLLALEGVRLPTERHPEGDALYHSLQVFDHARDEAPYDGEFLAAALLHDVGRAIDPADHGRAGALALEGYVSERTAWLIEHHAALDAVARGRLGARTRRRLEGSPYFQDLQALSECDLAGRQSGVEAPELEEALAYLQDVTEDP